jgi:hypothetical protein
LFVVDRWILRIGKKSKLCRAASQTSFHSCTDESEHVTVSNNDNTDNNEQYDDNIDDNDNNNNNNDDDDDDDDDDKEEYTWSTPTVIIHNILFGRLWCEFQGQIDIKHIQSNQHAIIRIKSPSWFTSQAAKKAELFKYHGFIYDGKYDYHSCQLTCGLFTLLSIVDHLLSIFDIYSCRILTRRY